MKKIIIICVAIALILGVMILFSYCGDRKIDAAIEVQVSTFVDAVLRGDEDAAYKVMSKSMEHTEFLRFYNTMRDVFGNAQSYELKQTGWRNVAYLGEHTYIAIYELETDTGAVFLLEAGMQKGSSHVYFMDFYDMFGRDKISNDTLLVINVILVLLSIGSYVFCIFMLADCAKRKEKYRWLWFALILMSVSLNINADVYGWGFGFDLGVLSRSMLTIRITDILITVTLPIGAFIYLIFRNFKPAEKKDTAYYDKLSLVLKASNQINELSKEENIDVGSDTSKT